MNPTVRGAEDRGRQAETTEGSDEPWWKTAVLYQVYLRSFADADGDGVGDLRGLIGHLDHLEWLGVDGLWLSPVTPSPNADWGYDVSDFRAVHPDFGTLDDLDRLVAEAGRRGIRILLDLVPNHTSDEHPWFLEAASSRLAERRDWYVWADAKPDGSPPNNWVSSFGGPAWTLHPDTGQYFLHNHLERQPDLNWWNDEVRDAFDGILRFWLDRGVAGFRIDVCNIIIKDADLRDNPPATEDDDFEAQMFGQRPVYNANRPEVHEVIRRWRALTETYPGGGVLIGETPVPVDDLVSYYGSGDELHLAFNFPFISAPFDAPALRAVVEATEAALPAGAWPAWTGSNHDMFRFPTRWAGDDPRRARVASADAALPPGHAGALSGRRDRTGRRHPGPRGPARPLGRPVLALLRRTRRRAHAHAVEAWTRRRVHRGGRAALVALGRRRGHQRRAPTVGSRLHVAPGS